MLLYVESWHGLLGVVCVCSCFFLRHTRAHEGGFMLIFLACCVQHIPSLLMALHHVLVCVHVL
mgnify:CR=1 FL=1